MWLRAMPACYVSMCSVDEAGGAVMVGIGGAVVVVDGGVAGSDVVNGVGVCSVGVNNKLCCGCGCVWGW